MTAHTLTPLVELKFDLLRVTTYIPWLVGCWDKFFQLKTEMRSIEELEGSQRIPSDEFFISQVILRSPMAW